MTRPGSAGSPSSPRHEAPPPPLPQAEQVFGAALPTACRYAALLAEEGVGWGLVGPAEVPRLWGRHLLNSAALAAFVASGADVLDVGSGAGLPGIPLHLARPDLQMTLLEPQSRRIRFLRLCRDRLALPDLRLLRLRAEQAGREHGAAVVTARAVAPLSRLVPAVWPLVRPGGQLLAVKGARAEAELAEVALPPDLAQPPAIVRRSGPAGEVLVTVVQFRKG